MVYWAGCLAAGVACLLRSNYMIFVLVLFAIYLLRFWQEGRLKNLLLIGFLFIAVIGMQKGLRSYYSHVVGQEVGPGTPMIAYATMGLRDVSATNGYWDRYNTNILEKYDFDYDKAKEVATTDFLARLEVYREKPVYALNFFKEKIMATWLEPTFQSSWSGPQIGRKQYTYTVLLRSLFEGRQAYRYYNILMSVMLTSFYIVLTLYLFWRYAIDKAKISAFELYPFIFLIGGFLFHLIWETKSQYTYMYIFLLLPTVAQSLVYFGDKLRQRFQR